MSPRPESPGARELGWEWSGVTWGPQAYDAHRNEAPGCTGDLGIRTWVPHSLSPAWLLPLTPYKHIVRGVSWSHRASSKALPHPAALQISWAPGLLPETLGSQAGSSPMAWYVALPYSPGIPEDEPDRVMVGTGKPWASPASVPVA